MLLKYQKKKQLELRDQVSPNDIMPPMYFLTLFTLLNYASAQFVSDSCINAISLSTPSDSFSGAVVNQTIMASNIVGGSSCNNLGATAYFKFTGNGASCTLTVRDDSENGGTAASFDTVIHILTGTCDNLMHGVCNDDSGIGLSSSVTFVSLPGVQYFAYVTEFGGNSNVDNFELRLQCETDSCQAPTMLQPTNATAPALTYLGLFPYYTTASISVCGTALSHDQILRERWFAFETDTTAADYVITVSDSSVNQLNFEVTRGCPTALLSTYFSKCATQGSTASLRLYNTEIDIRTVYRIRVFQFTEVAAALLQFSIKIEKAAGSSAGGGEEVHVTASSPANNVRYNSCAMTVRSPQSKENLAELYNVPARSFFFDVPSNSEFGSLPTGKELQVCVEVTRYLNDDEFSSGIDCAHWKLVVGGVALLRTAGTNAAQTGRNLKICMSTSVRVDLSVEQTSPGCATSVGDSKDGFELQVSCELRDLDPSGERCDTAWPLSVKEVVMTTCGDGIVDTLLGEACEPPNVPGDCDSECQDIVCPVQGGTQCLPVQCEDACTDSCIDSDVNVGQFCNTDEECRVSFCTGTCASPASGVCTGDVDCFVDNGLCQTLLGICLLSSTACIVGGPACPLFGGLPQTCIPTGSLGCTGNPAIVCTSNADCIDNSPVCQGTCLGCTESACGTGNCECSGDAQCPLGPCDPSICSLEFIPCASSLDCTTKLPEAYFCSPPNLPFVKIPCTGTTCPSFTPPNLAVSDCFAYCVAKPDGATCFQDNTPCSTDADCPCVAVFDNNSKGLCTGPISAAGPNAPPQFKLALPAPRPAEVSQPPLPRPSSAPVAQPLGVSGSSAASECCGGTLGAVIKAANGTYYALSNAHVLHGTIGGAVHNPGSMDATPVCSEQSLTTVAHLSRRASPETTNVDAAVASIVAGTVDGSLSGTADVLTQSDGSSVDVEVGLAVAKVGRTTGRTATTVVGIDADLYLQYTNDGACTSNTAETTSDPKRVCSSRWR